MKAHFSVISFLNAGTQIPVENRNKRCPHFITYTFLILKKIPPQLSVCTIDRGFETLVYVLEVEVTTSSNWYVLYYWIIIVNQEDHCNSMC